MVSEEFENLLVKVAEYQRTHFFGKYRGTVKTVGEEENLGYITAVVHEVFGEDFETDWAAPAAAFAGDKHGLVALPEVDDGVWIEFEAGDASRPIWSGFWWADGEMPEPKGPLIRTFITSKGHKLILDDENNEVKLLHADGAELTMTDSDVTIKIGQSTVKLSDSEISLENGTSGSIKISSSGVDLGNGAVKTS